MKLQMNERTLNAYINEAIRQELNEGKESIISKIKPKNLIKFLPKSWQEKLGKVVKTAEPRLAPHTNGRTATTFGRNTRIARGSRKALGSLRRGEVVAFSDITDDAAKAGKKGTTFYAKKLENGKVAFYSDAACEHMLGNNANLLKDGKVAEFTVGKKGTKVYGKLENGKVAFFEDIDCTKKARRSLSAAAQQQLDDEARLVRSGRKQIRNMKDVRTSAARNMAGTAAVGGLGVAALTGHKDDPWNAPEDQWDNGGDDAYGGGETNFEEDFPWDDTTPVWSPRPVRSGGRPHGSHGGGRQNTGNTQTDGETGNSVNTEIQNNVQDNGGQREELPSVSVYGAGVPTGVTYTGPSTTQIRPPQQHTLLPDTERRIQRTMDGYNRGLRDATSTGNHINYLVGQDNKKQDVNEEVDEGWFTKGRTGSTWYDPGTWGRSSENEKWGYEWDPNLTDRQNIRNRNVQKALIKQLGYKSHNEYVAGEGHPFNPEDFNMNGGEDSGRGEQRRAYPSVYPFKEDRQKTAQFQTWFNQNVGGHLVVDGIWGPLTERAYQQWLSIVQPTRRLDEAAFKNLVKTILSETFNR